MLPHTQSCLQFLQCSFTRATLRNETASPLFCTHVVLQSENCTVQKNANNHGDNQQLTECPRSVNSDDAPHFVTIMARCPDPLIVQKLLLWKKHPFSPEFMECVNLRIPVHREEKRGHFLSCQLQSFTPSIFIECKRQGVYFGVKKMWVLFISPMFTQNYHKSHTFLCHLSWWSHKHTTIN